MKGQRKVRREEGSLRGGRNIDVRSGQRFRSPAPPATFKCLVQQRRSSRCKEDRRPVSPVNSYTAPAARRRVTRRVECSESEDKCSGSKSVLEPVDLALAKGAKGSDYGPSFETPKTRCPARVSHASGFFIYISAHGFGRTRAGCVV